MAGHTGNIHRANLALLDKAQPISGYKLVQLLDLAGQFPAGIGIPNHKPGLYRLYQRQQRMDIPLVGNGLSGIFKGLMAGQEKSMGIIDERIAGNACLLYTSFRASRRVVWPLYRKRRYESMDKTLMPGYTIGADAYEDIPNVCPGYGRTAVMIGGKHALAAAEQKIRAAVSYTHLDVYKRQSLSAGRPILFMPASSPLTAP